MKKCYRSWRVKRLAQWDEEVLSQLKGEEMLLQLKDEEVSLQCGELKRCWHS